MTAVVGDSTKLHGFACQGTENSWQDGLHNETEVPLGLGSLFGFKAELPDYTCCPDVHLHLHLHLRPGLSKRDLKRTLLRVLVKLEM